MELVAEIVRLCFQYHIRRGLCGADCYICKVVMYMKGTVPENMR
ncbi:hypothetical protein APHCRT_0369 [Anaplasma phagocytophilum str. CRT53-1]|uniref:Uncharacterized protein n=1 Tax=Anaplasma phagocytophilum str. CRT53-1 TaxID=1359157 RepID=A0A0F3Q5Z2_ANAPH|nr:hypothetical protein APHCRT_0369 [Anaplasma phagocytophilum str. CRT53-1]